MTVEEGIERLLETDHLEVENLQHTRDGQRLVMESHVTLLRDEQHEPVSILVISRDITARKHAEDALAYQANLLAMATEPIMAFDPDGRITYWNPGAERAYGWQPDEVIGRSFREALHRVPDPVWETGRSERLEQINRGDTIQGEFLGARKDGSPVWIEYSTRAFFDRAGRFPATLRSTAMSPSAGGLSNNSPSKPSCSLTSATR